MIDTYPDPRVRKNALHRAWYARYVTEHPDYLARKREAAKRYADAYPEKVLEQQRAANTRYRKAHPEVMRARRHTRREEVLAFFGGACVACGFNDPRALQVDHINGGGHRERRAGSGTIREQHRLVVADPTAARAKYQLLCANYNLVKGH